MASDGSTSNSNRPIILWKPGEIRWATFLPGFPDGSYGFAKVDGYFSKEEITLRLFVEYVGQGDSDKPDGYSYSTMKRADLVEALWREHGITSTFVVAFDYSNIVLLELLSRQQEHTESGSTPFTLITEVVTINGGLFADAHTHPWHVTPLLKSPFGTIGTWTAQRSKFAFNMMMKPVFSEEYKVSQEELDEIYDAITRRNGASFMSRAAGFVDEHKEYEDRWNLERLYPALRETVSFHLVGSEGDNLEFNQILKAQERLGNYEIDIQVISGGHMATAERPELLAEIIRKSWETNSE